MRILLALLIATPALAAPKKPPASKQVHLSAPPRRGDLSMTGELRAIDAPVDVQITATGQVAQGEPEREHGPGAEVHRDAPAQLSDGAVAELAERQMRKNLGSIDACVAAETQRNPQAAGTLTLQITVANKIGTLAIADDTIKSPALADCLNQAARSWSFSLKAAEFAWPISVGKRR
jgi:hypothetical protein